jgi:hypothetical protein
MLEWLSLLPFATVAGFVEFLKTGVTLATADTTF